MPNGIILDMDCEFRQIVWFGKYCYRLQQRQPQAVSRARSHCYQRPPSHYQLDQCVVSWLAWPCVSSRRYLVCRSFPDFADSGQWSC